VFIDLARKAKSLTAKLTEDASLVGWLYRATRFAALNLRRGEHRRQSRERQAMEQFHPACETAADWERVHPVLDEAMSDLADDDREALLLRFFKNQDFRAIGIALGITDDTAQKRVSRAVDQLRESFSKRGVAVGAGGLVVAISANAVQAAPVGLAAAISTAALAAGTTVSATATITKVIAMTTLQKALVTATVAVAVGAGIYEARQVSSLRTEVDMLRQQQQQLERERDDTVNRLTRLTDETATLKNDSNELAGLPDDVSRLKAAMPTMKNQQAKEAGHAQQKTALETMYASLFKNLKVPA
jgi:RNA polymerase sigma factor (sigma-70 family)